MNTFKSNGKCTVTVFFNQQPKILEVKDSAGNVYFFREIEGQKSIKFNILKSDVFKLNCNAENIKISPLSITPLNIVLPTQDRNEMKQFKIIFNPNLKGTPARNYFIKGIIEVGEIFKKQIYPIRVFILLHEVAHFYYEDEETADLFAAKKFVDMGFNNSTAFYALRNVLNFESKRNKQRLINLFKNLQR